MEVLALPRQVCLYGFERAQPCTPVFHWVSITILISARNFAFLFLHCVCACAWCVYVHVCMCLYMYAFQQTKGVGMPILVWYIV